MRLTGKEILRATYHEAVRRGCDQKVYGDNAWFSRHNRNRWVRLIGSDGETVTVSFTANRKAIPVRYTVEA